MDSSGVKGSLGPGLNLPSISTLYTVSQSHGILYATLWQRARRMFLDEIRNSKVLFEDVSSVMITENFTYWIRNIVDVRENDRSLVLSRASLTIRDEGIYL